MDPSSQLDGWTHVPSWLQRPNSCPGEVTGGIYICGGFSDHGCPGVVSAGQLARPISGTVVVSASGRTVTRIHVRDGQNYFVGLPAGTYAVSAGSQFPAVRVVIAAGKTITANLVEQIP